MKPYTDYIVKLGDLKTAIVKNPYDPQKNIDGYMRYLKYNTKEAIENTSSKQIIHCKDCTHRYYADNRIPSQRCYVCAQWGVDDIDENGFCDHAELREDNTNEQID